MKFVVWILLKSIWVDRNVRYFDLERKKVSIVLGLEIIIKNDRIASENFSMKPLSFLEGAIPTDSALLNLLRHLRLMTSLPLFLKWNELLPYHLTSFLNWLCLGKVLDMARTGSIAFCLKKIKAIGNVVITWKINITGIVHKWSSLN